MEKYCPDHTAVFAKMEVQENEIENMKQTIASLKDKLCTFQDTTNKKLESMQAKFDNFTGAMLILVPISTTILTLLVKRYFP